MGSKSQAERFEEPPGSPSHASLRESAWLGGDLTEGRYFLSWATGANHFHQNHEEYEKAYRDFVIKTWPASRVFLQSHYWMQFYLVVLRHLYRESEVGKSFPIRAEHQDERALRILLTNPSMQHAELAKTLKTTEKQLLRMSNVQLAYRELTRNSVSPQSSKKQRKA